MYLIRNIKCVDISYTSLVLAILVINLLFSMLFFVGNVDQDFYAYYYIGKGVVFGKDMFADFSENKGPMTYLFFAFLYLLFKNNSTFALVLASFVIDILVFLLSLHVVDKLFDLNFKGKNVLSIFVFVVFKSLSFGQLGGVYTQSIALVFILLSLSFINKHNILSGIMFGLALLTRQNFVLFGLIMFTMLATSPRRTKSFLKFAVGVLIPIGIFLGASFGLGNFNFVLENMYFMLLDYSDATSRLRWISIIISIANYQLLIILFLTTIVCIVLYILDNQDKRKRINMVSLLISSVLVTFSSGIFYYHHFIQFSLMIIAAFAFLSRKYPSNNFILIIIALLSGFQMVAYGTGGGYSKDMENKQKVLEKLKSYEYIQVVPFYPEYYLTYDKFAPTRYYNPNVLLTNFNSKAEEYVYDHNNTLFSKMSKTAVVAIETQRREDLYRIDAYIKLLEKQYKLTLIDTFRQGFASIKIYSIHPKDAAII